MHARTLLHFMMCRCSPKLHMWFWFDGLLCVTNCGRMGAVAPWETSENRAISRGYSSCFVYMSSIAIAANESSVATTTCPAMAADSLCMITLNVVTDCAPGFVLYSTPTTSFTSAGSGSEVNSKCARSKRSSSPIAYTPEHTRSHVQEFGPIPHRISQGVPPPRHAHLSVVVLCCFFFVFVCQQRIGTENVLQKYARFQIEQYVEVVLAVDAVRLFVLQLNTVPAGRQRCCSAKHIRLEW